MTKDCFYFVHSYCFYNDNKNDVIATTEYNYSFVSAIHFENIYGVQFHPEKSQKSGIQLLRNFFEYLKQKKKRLIPVLLLKNGMLVQSRGFFQTSNFR
jgi:hypothetical protein